MYDLCIIGGGPSGMTTAIKAKLLNPKLKVVILEKNQKLGRKLLATGNGRCNMSNMNCQEFRMTLAFFEEIGILAKADDEGRFYPYSEEAKDVLAALEFSLERLNIEVISGFAVASVKRLKDGIFLTTDGKDEKKSGKVVIATGGKAAPEFGTIGDGYKLARELGHTVTKTIPVLAPVICQEDCSKFAGIRQNCRLTLERDGRQVFVEEGQLQMTKDGISGICVFNMTRFLEIDQEETVEDGMNRYTVKVDFMPEILDEQVVEIITERHFISQLSILATLRGLVKEAVARDIITKLNLKPDDAALSLSEEEIGNMALLLKNWLLKIKGVKGWKWAQATKGGIPQDEINMATMESRIIKGLFFTGEVIDYDGPCGGFNLQNAWETAIKAGEYIGGDL